MKEKSNYIKGVLSILVSALAFATMALFVKKMGPVPLMQKTLFRSSVTVVITTIIFLKGRTPFRIGSKKGVALLLLRSILGTTGIILNFYAIDHLLISDANVIMRLSTVLVIVFSWIFLGDRIKSVHMAAITVAFTGVIFIIKPQFSFEMVPYLVALLGAAAAAGAYTTLRALRKLEHPAVIIMFFSIFSLLVAFPFVIAAPYKMTLAQWIYGGFAGVFAALGQFGVTYAYQFAPAKEISIFEYFSIIFSTILGFIFFSERPDIWSVIGYGLVFGAAYILHRYNRRTAGD